MKLIWIERATGSLHNPRFNMLEIKESLIEGAGLGVFATEDINQGNILTEYHGSKMTHEQYTNYQFNTKIDTAIVFLEFYTLGNTNQYNSKQCGQMINDCDSISGKYYETIDALNQDITSYNNKSLANCNVDVTIRDNLHHMKSLTQINKGQELYFHYGHGYWLSLMNANQFSNSVLHYINNILNQTISQNSFIEKVVNFKK